MSIPTQGATQQSQIAAQKVVGQEGEDAIGGEGSTRMDLLRHRVHPPAGLGGRLPPVVADPVQIDNEFSGGMNSGSYFSNLMSNGIYTASEPLDSPLPDPEVYVAGQPDDNPPPGEGASQGHAHGVARGTNKRSKNFSVDEDLLLVSAWLNVSLDPIQGVDQSRSTYWKRIYDYFYVNKKFSSDRSQGSLMNRWSGIQHDVTVFAGCVTRIECRNQSGCSVDDKIASACAMFKDEDKTHRNFPYMHCWKVLKVKPKWMERRKHSSNPNRGGKKQKISADASPSASAVALVGGNADGGEPSKSVQERPLGKKKEKQRLRQRASLEAMEYLLDKKKEADAIKELKKEERCKKAFALQEERIKIERERVQFKRQLEEERIMNIDMTTLNYKQQQYYEGSKTRFLLNV